MDYVEAGVWQTRRLHEIVDARAIDDPHREAAVDQTRRLTYAQLVAASHSLARFLLDNGVQDGDCVAIQSPNRVELAITHLACSRAGATFVPLSPAWGRTELRHLLGVARAVVAIVPEEAPELPHLRLVRTLDDLGEVLATPAEPVNESSDPNLPRYVMVSSGTTSLPKLSLWTDNNLWWFGEFWSRAVALSFKDRVVGLAPAGTGAIGYVYGVLFPLLRGARRRSCSSAGTRPPPSACSSASGARWRSRSRPRSSSCSSSRRSNGRTCARCGSSPTRARRCRPPRPNGSSGHGTAASRPSTARPTAASR